MVRVINGMYKVVREGFLRDIYSSVDAETLARLRNPRKDKPAEMLDTGAELPVGTILMLLELITLNPDAEKNIGLYQIMAIAGNARPFLENCLTIISEQTAENYLKLASTNNR